MDEFLENIVKTSQEALASGFTLEEVNARIQEVTAGRGDFDSLKAVRKATDPANIEALKRLSAVGGSAVGDFFNLLGSGASFGFADELIGAVSPERGKAFRKRTKAVKELSPKTATAVQIGGGLLSLGLTGGKTTQLAARAGASPSLAGLAGGTVAGGVAGGLVGAGEAEGGLLERIKPAAKSAAIGGLLGAPIGALSGRLGSAGIRIRGSRPERITKALREGTGITRGIKEISDAAAAKVEQVRQRFFQPLDRAFPTVDDPQIIGFIRRMARNDDTKSSIVTVSRNVAKGKRLPSFSDLQNIRGRLFDKGLRNEADELTVLMEEAFPRLREGNRAFREAKEVEKAFVMGRKLFNKDADDIAIAVQQQSTEQAREALRSGQVVETISRLERREETATGQLRSLLDAGRTTQNLFRQMFPEGPEGTQAFNQFLRAARAEASADKLSKTFKILGGSVARLAGLGAGFGAASQLLGGAP